MSIGAPSGRLGHVSLLKECRKIITNSALENEASNASEGEDVEINVSCVKCCRLKRGMVTDSHSTDLKCKPYARGNNLIRDGHETEEGEPCTKGHDGLTAEREKRGLETYSKTGCPGKHTVRINEERKNICKTPCNGEAVLLKEDLALPFESLREKLDVHPASCDGVVGAPSVVNIPLKLCEMCVLSAEESHCPCDCSLEKSCHSVDVL